MIAQERYDRMVPEEPEHEYIEKITIKFRGEKFVVNLNKRLEDQSFSILESSFVGFLDMEESDQVDLMDEFEECANEYIESCTRFDEVKKMFYLI